MTQQALIVGGGIGGLAAAFACKRAGWLVRLYEKAPHFSEFGAGIQLGPNATRILARWGLADALGQVAAFPRLLVIRDARDGSRLGSLELNDAMDRRYGAPYATVHRADLHGLLLQAAQGADVFLETAAQVDSARPGADAVALRLHGGLEVEGDALVVADGLWSNLRGAVCDDASAPVFTGHLAYRSLVDQEALPASLRSQDVTVWWGPRLHVVSYPVRSGRQLNVVALIHAARPGSAPGEWDHAAVAGDLFNAMGPMADGLQGLMHAMPHWRLWTLHDRPPVRSAAAMARGRAALLGDAAHPMQPYFAQGAGMAIEDAAELGRCLSMDALDVPLALQRYALARWQRVGRVQALSRRNGWIFHADGITRFGRDLSLRLLGERLLDQPWLYRET